MNNPEPQKPPQVGGSELNVQLCSIKQMINAGFMTVNNSLSGCTVEIKLPTLHQAHELHRALCKLPDV